MWHVHERLSRRRMIQVASGLLLASVVDFRPTGVGLGAAAMTRMRFVERGVFPRQGRYQSAVFRADQPFNSLELSWEADLPPGSGLRLALRASADGAVWTEWIEVHPDGHAAAPGAPRQFAAPVLVAPSGYAQYRVDLSASDRGQAPDLGEVALSCVDTSQPAQFLSMASPPPPIDGWIIPRATWGADESLRFDAHGDEIWPEAYRPLQKVIIHHTATQNQEDDPAATVRAIYYYHAVTLGWGDIGYNFLVDWHGNVYEGRFGGPNVVGGHALQYNYGSLGVALIGTYDDVDAQPASYDALLRLIRDRAGNLDPAGVSYFIDTDNVPNICGHRDVLQTDCPGELAYAHIPTVRGLLKGTGPIFLGAELPPPSSAALTSARFAPATVYPGCLLRVDAEVRNTGTATIYTQAPPPGTIYAEGQDFNTPAYAKVTGMYRLGVDFAGNAGLPNPFRWGLPGPLAPGESATVTGFMRLRSVRDWTFSASLVEEYMQYFAQNAFPQPVSVLPPPVGATPQATEPGFVYEPATGHNVPRVFHDYWAANGGLERFGYPLTEPYEEVSETDQQIYLTQYFERARFEHHPENAGTPYEVLLGLLGRERTAQRVGEAPFTPLAHGVSSPGVDFYPETGHTLAHGFRAYWQQHGGLAVFGYPISEEFQEVSQTDGQE
ncbi:MAG TPA: N-acetylmuramoyl-L-alanine amidase, partial [Thermomicrobiaceae bacterium]|nr:N-acetylmuramoyl-L-alanine amidase [Thermomicrobiaceae bacterium]